MTPASILRRWFTWSAPVGRGAYLASGLILAILKFSGDTAIVQAAGGTWTPLDYLRPISVLRGLPQVSAESWLMPVLLLWMLPFLWIGVTMSARRAVDAGFSGWLCLVFFMPYVNYLLMAALSIAPTRLWPVAGEPQIEAVRVADGGFVNRLRAGAVGLAAGIGLVALAVLVFRSYGEGLFIGTPFAMGAVSAFFHNRRVRASITETQGVVLVTLLLTGALVFLIAIEGAACLMMAAPMAVGIAMAGGVVGRALALGAGGVRSSTALIIVALPGVLTFDAASTGGLAVHEVRSEIVINASPDRVWSNVIAFPPLAPPDELVFKAGVAYPIRAEIVGQGVGAIRYCVFSTGPFVEPITAWEPGRRLAFDVTSAPDPMREWSPYAGVHPAHLDGYFQSRRGEFRLVPMPDGRTRLEGSTWYELNMGPEGYWQMLTDALIHRIHLRVLDHIKRETERQVR